MHHLHIMLVFTGRFGVNEALIYLQCSPIRNSCHVSEQQCDHGWVPQNDMVGDAYCLQNDHGEGIEYMDLHVFC